MEEEDSIFRPSEGVSVTVVKEDDTGVLCATKLLLEFNKYLAISTVVALILVTIDQFNPSAVPAWSIYTTLFVGQAGVFINALRCIYLAVTPLLFGSCEYNVKDLMALARRDRRTWTQEERVRWNRAMRWRAANWNLLLLLQKTVIAAAWVLLLTLCVVNSEALAWGSTSAWAWVVPLYLVVGIRVFNSFLCQSMPVVEILSWLSIAVFLVLYNVKAASSSLTLDWFAVMLPLSVLLGVWLLTTLYLLLEYICGAILLKTRQLEALYLYLCSFVCLLVAVTLYDFQRGEGDSLYPAPALLATSGTTLLFMGLHISVAEAVETMIMRKGSKRPIPVSSFPGGVASDMSKAYRYNLLIGEYETPDSVNDDGYRRTNKSHNDSCLLYHAILLVRLLDKVFSVVGVDVLGCVDEQRSRRDKSACNCCESCMSTNTLCACVCCGALELMEWDQEELSERGPGSAEEAQPMMTDVHARS